MQHFADTAAREKRQREEPQLSCAEPCLADVQLGCPLHVQLGSPEHVLLLRAALAEVKVCRGGRNKTSLRFKGKPPSWCQQQTHLLESASAKVDQAFVRAPFWCARVESLEFVLQCVGDGLLAPCRSRVPRS